MITDESLHRTFDDHTHATPLGMSSLLEHIAEIEGYRTDKIDGIRTVISVIADITTEECPEGIEDELVNLGNINILAEERNKRGKEAVRLRLTIYLAYDREQIEAVFVKETIANFLRHLFLEHVADKQFAEHSTRTLVAKDESERRNVVDNAFAVVEA